MSITKLFWEQYSPVLARTGHGMYVKLNNQGIDVILVQAPTSKVPKPFRKSVLEIVVSKEFPDHFCNLPLKVMYRL